MARTAFRLVPALAVCAALAQAQTPAPLEFEVASIRPSAPISPQMTAGVHIDGSQVNCVLLSLKDYIAWAYKVKDYQILGPAWMAGARFDINGKVPSGTTTEQVGDMLKALLADRFQMKLHRETKELPVYALVQAKGGAKLKESPKDAAGDAAQKPKEVNIVSNTNSGGTTIDMGNGGSVFVGNNKLEGHKMPTLGFTETLARFTDRPVVDMTGLTGLYDFTLEFTPEDFRAMMIRAAVIAGVTMPPEALKLMDSASGDSMITALDSIGLKLDPRKSPLEVLVIDHIEKTPSDN